LNLFGFVGNNALSELDILGLEEFKIVAKSFIGKVGSGGLANGVTGMYTE
jgi:hypothetical protein